MPFNKLIARRYSLWIARGIPFTMEWEKQNEINMKFMEKCGGKKVELQKKTVRKNINLKNK